MRFSWWGGQGSGGGEEGSKKCKGKVGVSRNKAQLCHSVSETKTVVKSYKLNLPEAIHLPLISLLQVIFVHCFQHLHRSYLNQ